MDFWLPAKCCQVYKHNNIYMCLMLLYLEADVTQIAIKQPYKGNLIGSTNQVPCNID